MKSEYEVGIFSCHLFAYQNPSSPQGHGRLVRGEQRQRQHPAMAEEEPAALQPAVRGPEAAGDEGDGAPQPGQPLPGQHWDPSPPLPPTLPPQSPPLWHAEGRAAPGGGEGRVGGGGDVHLLYFFFLRHIRASALAVTSNLASGSIDGFPPHPPLRHHFWFHKEPFKPGFFKEPCSKRVTLKNL